MQRTLLEKQLVDTPADQNNSSNGLSKIVIVRLL